MNQSELIGYKLKQHRMKLGWTQEQMADKLNVRQNTVSGYEKDGVHDIDTIMEINHRLGINLLSENKEEQSFNNIILKKICNYYMDNSDTMYPFANILTKTFLQGNLLHGYGKDTGTTFKVHYRIMMKMGLKILLNPYCQKKWIITVILQQAHC
ncbi:MAG: helix-turn-helix transcriptional regulator [Bacillota bacterium]|nr:helix-turn-helix transcriptional regulator [Bacillota bacterium]